MLVFACLICSVLVISMVYLVSRVLWLHSCVRHLPRIPLRMLVSFLTQTKAPRELYQSLQTILNYYDGMASAWFGTKLAIICDDPVNIKTILMSKDCVNKPYYYRMMRLAGKGLFTASSHDWQSDRKAISTVFALSILKTFEPIFNHHFANLTKTLEKFVDQPEFELTKHIHHCHFSSVLDTNFRYDYHLLNDDSDKLINSLARLWKISTMRACSPLLHSKFIYRFTSLYTEEKKIIDCLDKIAPKVKSHSLEKRKCELSNETVTEWDDSKPMNLIDKLADLEEKDQMDRQCVLDQINTFLVAGIDSTSFTVLNTLLLLAMNQNVQNRVYEELRSTVVDYNYIDYETLAKLEYLDRVLKESMRLLTLSFVWLRETEADIQLTHCTAPKGTVFVLNIFKLHRSEKIWGPSANQFDPDRFLPELVAQRHPFAFLPFSAGPRNCIGNKYAMNSMKVMLCHLLLEYKFLTSIQMHDISHKFAFSLKLNNKYMFKLERRIVR